MVDVEIALGQYTGKDGNTAKEFPGEISLKASHSEARRLEGGKPIPKATSAQLW